MLPLSTVPDRGAGCINDVACVDPLSSLLDWRIQRPPKVVWPVIEEQLLTHLDGARGHEADHWLIALAQAFLHFEVRLIARVTEEACPVGKVRILSVNE
jgi:hypothetical protein